MAAQTPDGDMSSRRTGERRVLGFDLTEWVMLLVGIALDGVLLVLLL
jgi:hypothetical protein